MTWLLGFGAYNACGVQLVNWVLQNGLPILSRQSDNQDTSEGWKCEKYFDEARVQVDYTLANGKAVVLRVWNDNMLPGPSLCTLFVDIGGAKK